MRRVVVLGRGGAGKSTLARELGVLTGLPVVELDRHFWSADLLAPDPQRWTDIQAELIRADSWIMDGDLGAHDVLDVRLRAADTVLVLDFSLLRCAWRAARRSRERADFWRWLLTYRHRWLPLIMATIARNAPAANVIVFRSQVALRGWVARCAATSTRASGWWRPAPQESLLDLVGLVDDADGADDVARHR